MLAPRISVLNLRKDVGSDTNKALLISFGPSVRFGFFNPIDVEMVDGKPTFCPKLFSPYAEVGMRLVYTDLSAHSESISSKRLTYGGVVTIGTGIQKNAFIQAKLILLPKIEAYSFSTLSVEFGVRF